MCFYSAPLWIELLSMAAWRTSPFNLQSPPTRCSLVLSSTTTSKAWSSVWWTSRLTRSSDQNTSRPLRIQRKPEILCIVTTTHLATNPCNKAKTRPTATAAAAVAVAVVVVAAAAAAAAVAVAAVKRILTAQVAVVVVAAAAAAVVKKLQNPTEESHESKKKSAMTPAVLQMTADLRI